MWLLRIALRRPYTFLVMALLIALVGGYSVETTPVDIFPTIDIPVISVIWNYGGLPPDQMEKRVVNNFERFLTTIVSDIDHIESQSLTGIAVIKIYLQPDANLDEAVAETTSVAQTAVRAMPPGATPPLIIRYSATAVPIMDVALQSDTLSEQQLFDYSLNFIRADIATVHGAEIPYPYGGRQRQIMVDIDPKRLQGWGLSPRDVQAALGLQNVVLPTGSIKLGENEYPVVMNATAEAVADLGDLPIKTVAGRTIYIKDVASVRDGNAPQTSMVHVEGRNSVLMPILKNGNASTLAVNDAIKERLPHAVDHLPKEAQGHLQVKLLFDQSVFVRASIDGVVREAAIAAGLTALMILLFLGSWRSTLIVVTSIPLSILFSIIALKAIGETLNVMTLGGMALAVGILVDDATVAIENIHRNIAQGKPFIQAIVDGASQIATPALVSTLCICIVFVPVALLTGVARSLFLPLALAVVFAMLMSYLLSRTLVPTLVRYLLPKEKHGSSIFDRAFQRFRSFYGRYLAWALANRAFVAVGFLVFVAASLSMAPVVGRDFFPTVDAGLIKLHVRGAPGTRLEESAKRIGAIERTIGGDRDDPTIKGVIPREQIETMLDVMGTPTSGINLSLSEGALISSADAQILISLKPGHTPVAELEHQLRAVLAEQYPDDTFFFLAPDISTQVLNFGVAAPIDVQVQGPVGSEDATFALAQELAARVRKIPGAVDVHLAQVQRVPAIDIDVDRTEASQAGLTERDVASDVLVSLASSGQVAPSFWLDKRGVQYPVAVQTPQYAMSSMDKLTDTPLSTGGGVPQTLGNVATVSRSTTPANVTHYNIARVFDVQANVEGTDLGSVADGVDRILDEMRKTAPKGTTYRVKGQVESMQSSFDGLASGLVFAILLVYLLMVVNFQSWLDPFVILMALPGALAGIVWMLFLTHTTISVPALIGAIMCVGVATANSILVVSFANEQRDVGRNAHDAALAAGMTRLRPVMMTALAMIIGMLPMAIGFGEGAEQNAPLGRAVIGGLTVATLSTLFFVPVMYSLLRRKAPKHQELEIA